MELAVTDGQVSLPIPRELVQHSVEVPIRKLPDCHVPCALVAYLGLKVVPEELLEVLDYPHIEVPYGDLLPIRNYAFTIFYAQSGSSTAPK
jgi:hypothetical protein